MLRVGNNNIHKLFQWSYLKVYFLEELWWGISDSDDTDVLLLARPSIFIEHNTELDPLASVEIVDNIISHVSDLENRVSIIESINSPCSNGSFKEYRSISPMVLNDLETSLNQSLPTLASDELPIQIILSPISDENLTSPPLALKTSSVCSNTESTQDLTVISNDASKYKENLLKEIDIYLRSNKTRMDGDLLNAGKNKIMNKPAESVADSIIRRSSPEDKLDLPRVDMLLREIEATHLEIENKLQTREAEYGILNQKSFSNVGHRRSFPPVDICSIPERNRTSYGSHSSPLKSNSEVEKPKSLVDFAGKREIYLVGSSHNSDSDDGRKNVGISNSIEMDPVKTNSNIESRRRFPSPRRRLFTQSDNYPNRKLTSIPSSSTSNDQDVPRRNYYTHYGAGDGPQNSISRITESKIEKDKLMKSQYNR